MLVSFWGMDYQHVLITSPDVFSYQSHVSLHVQVEGSSAKATYSSSVLLSSLNALI